jgi:flagellar basal-body rod protein FlgB
VKIDDTTVKTLLASLNFRQMRQELISSNIANAETPGYKAKRIDFEEALAKAIDLDKLQNMNVTEREHFNVGGGGFTNLQPEVYQDPNGVVSEDGNTVDRANEMALMAENKILYDAMVQLLNKKMGLKKYIVNSDR